MRDLSNPKLLAHHTTRHSRNMLHEVLSLRGRTPCGGGGGQEELNVLRAQFRLLGGAEGRRAQLWVTTWIVPGLGM